MTSEIRSVAPTTLVSTGLRIARSALTPFLVGLVYLVAAMLALRLASINPSATPIWPPTGLALASVLLWGYRVSPAIYVAALIANIATAGSIYTSAIIAFGNTAECLVGAYLVNRWSGGVATFDTPTGIARFALMSLLAAAISATVGVATLVAAGFADADHGLLIWTTWWLGDLAGAIVVSPVVVLWSKAGTSARGRKELGASAATAGAAAAIGVLTFSPLVADGAAKNALGFLAIIPLLWAALRGSRADTATAALILSALAVWGAAAQTGPFAHSNTQNDSFLLLLMFVLSVSLPSLILSADVGVRRRAEQHQRLLMAELDHRVKNTLAIVQAIASLTLRNSPSPEAFNTAFLARLRAMALNHELLARNRWTGVSIEQIVADTLAPYADAGERIATSGPHLTLQAVAATPLGMVIHELATNAAKHGALSAPAGRVTLEWSTEAGILFLRWTESDGPPVQVPARRGLGLKVIDYSLKALGGEVDTSFAASGFTCALRLPLCDVKQQP